MSRSGDRIYRVVIRACWLLFRALGLRFDVRGTSYLPADGAAIVACNHIGYLDFTFLGLAASHRQRLVRFMAKQSTFDNPVSGPLMRSMAHIPVDRSCGAAAYRHAERLLQRGELVGIFPEATISRAWMLKPFKLGAAALAVQEQVPLVPAVVWGGHRVLTVGGRWSLRRGKAVSVFLGEALVPGRYDDVVAVSGELHRRMQQLLEVAQRSYPQAPRNDADRWWLPQHLGGTAPAPSAAAELDAVALAKAGVRR